MHPIFITAMFHAELSENEVKQHDNGAAAVVSNDDREQVMVRRVQLYAERDDAAQIQ